MTKSKSVKDLLLIIIATSIIAYILISIDAFELFTDFANNHEEYELDEVILILLVGAFSLLWYSFRRFQEIKELKKIIENNNKELNSDNIKKDELLLEQIKMASLGEMIENIAHQWRQPLSLISTSASGLKVKKEFNKLDEKDIDDTLNLIMINTKYLSNTIDDFRNFIKNEEAIVSFNLKDVIDNTLNILKGNFHISNISPILKLDKDIKMEGYPNELTQVLINIINNAKDAFEDKIIEKKYIFISSQISSDKIQINIKDNAEGISNKILSQIFEPYITTKYNSKGTGLGLFMSYKIITERFNGSIYAKNTVFTYEDIEYAGAEFIIEIPFNHLLNS